MANINVTNIITGAEVIDSDNILSVQSIYVGIDGVDVIEGGGGILATKITLTGDVIIYVSESSGYINDRIPLTPCCPPDFEGVLGGSCETPMSVVICDGVTPQLLITTVTDVIDTNYDFDGSSNNLVSWSVKNIDSNSITVVVNGQNVTMDVTGTSIESTVISSNQFLNDTISVVENGGVGKIARVTEVRLV